MKAVQARTRISQKNFLFATAFSQAADAAAPFAIQIARSYGAKMYGVHVNPFDNYTAAAPDAWAALAAAAERQTKEHAQRLNEQLKGVEHKVVIGEGNIWEVISNLIKQKEIDLIVLGTRGRTGLGKALLGSVAEQILRRAAWPVLTVGPAVTPPHEQAGLGSKRAGVADDKVHVHSSERGDSSQGCFRGKVPRPHGSWLRAN